MRALRTPLWISWLVIVSLSTAQAKTNYAYVSDNLSTTVTVINTSSNSIVKTITVGNAPTLIAVNQAGSFAYVANQGSDSVSVISTSTNTVTATIPVGTRPAGVVLAPNGKTAYVTNFGSTTVSVINTGTKTVKATVTVGSAPLGLAVTPNGAFVYVANTQSDSVSIISTLTNKVVATVSVCSKPAGVAISPDGSTAYVGCTNANAVDVIRTADNAVVNTISSVPHAYLSAVSPDGHWLYVINASSGEVTVIDTRTQTIAANVVVGSDPQVVAFTEDSTFAYVTNCSANDVSVINTASQTVVQTISGVPCGSGVGVMGTVHVTTVAGGFVGDKGPAKSAALGAPYSSVLDSTGNLYISDVVNRIRKVDTLGNITTIAGNGICGYNGENIPANTALVCFPNGLVFDSAGNLVFGDSTSRIRKIDHSTGKISTIAGDGVFGYSGDGASALKASIGQPFQITYDSTGNLYFDQVGDCVVRKVDTGGIITTVAGTGTCGYNGDNIPAKTAELNEPRGVVVDSSGNVYIGDTFNHRVRKVDTTGTITTFAGNGSPGFSGDGGLATNAKIGGPRGLTIYNGSLYISNAGSARVRYVNFSSNIINTFAGSSYGYDGDNNPLLSSRFTGPVNTIFDPAGNPIFADNFNGRVRQAVGGIVNTIAGGYIGDSAKATAAALVLPEALAIDKSGNLYIADEEGNRIRKVSGGIISTIAGKSINGYSGDGGPGTSAMINEPAGVAVDSLGNVFIADSFNDVIRKLDTTGAITTLSADPNFGYLLQMATDSSNNVYVADNAACVVWKITPAGVDSIVAGVLNTCGYNGDGIAATSAQLNGPYSVTFDSSGNMLIADNRNSRVREVNTSGIISTVAGNGTCGYTGDGGSATSAELCPNSVAADKSGTVYVADFSSERIRKIKGGIITTFAGAGFGFNGDKLWPLYTTLDDPVAVAVDSKGAVYELDDFDHRVRKIQ